MFSTTLHQTTLQNHPPTYPILSPSAPPKKKTFPTTSAPNRPPKPRKKEENALATCRSFLSQPLNPLRNPLLPSTLLHRIRAADPTGPCRPGDAARSAAPSSRGCPAPRTSAPRPARHGAQRGARARRGRCTGAAHIR